MSIKIPIVSDFDGKGIKKAIAEFKQLETTGQKAQFALKKATVPAVAALAGLGTATFKAAQRASDLAEEQSKVGVVFGEASKEVLDFSRTAARALGQSQTQALKAAGTFGVLGKAAGLTGSDLAGFTTQFTTLASDLASFNNTSPEDAIQAIGAALRGEAEPIRRYGVLLDDATLRNKALQLGLIKTTKDALNPATKSLAAQAVILEQTKDAQGDFARTSDGVANQQRILKANFENLSTSIGNAFLPVLERATSGLADFGGWASENSDLVVALTITFSGLATAVLAARSAMIIYKGIAFATTKVNAALAASGFAVQISTGVGIATAALGVAALAGITYQLTTMFRTQEDAYEGSTKAAIENREINEMIANGTLPDLSKAQADLTGATSLATMKLAEQNAKLKELRNTIKGDFKNAMESAQGILKNAQDSFTNFGKSVSDSITGAFSFKDAQEAGAESGSGFLSALAAQAAKTQDFTVKVNRLLAAGLSEGALQQVLAAGQDAGGAIADELLNGGAAAIGEANALTAKVQSLGESVGLNAATQFYQGGVDAGNSLVEGISSVVSKYKLKLSSKALTEKQLKRLQRNFGIDVDFLMSGGIPAMANGGIVTGPTLALIGEAGPEAVIPLDRAGSMGGINITVNAGLVSSPDQVGQQIIEAIQKAQRRSGPVFAPA